MHGRTRCVWQCDPGVREIHQKTGRASLARVRPLSSQPSSLYRRRSECSRWLSDYVKEVSMQSSSIHTYKRTCMDFKASDVAATAALGPHIGQPSSIFSVKLSTVRKEDMISKRRSVDTTFHETWLACVLSAGLVTRTDGSGGGLDGVDAEVVGIEGLGDEVDLFCPNPRTFLKRSRLRVR
jgi:hypothetical protein